MRKIFIVALTIVIALLLVSCSREEAVTPQLGTTEIVSSTLTINTERLASEILLASGWEEDSEIDLSAKMLKPKGDGEALTVLNFEREQISGNIYHYSWRIRIGWGNFDVVRVHRVVKERAPYCPIRSRKSVFMLHGDFKDFEGCFMPGLMSQLNPDDFGIAVSLAQENIDVWGMDQAFCLIPADETDFSSLADWDMYKFAQDTRTGLAIARTVRLFTGNGFRKMNLLGFSGGAVLGFAVVNEETMLPYGKRHVGGFIPVDQGLFSDDEDFAASDCGTAQYYAELVDSGEFVEENFFPMFGVPAREDPEGPSELIEGFNNLQAALAVAVYPAVEGFPYHYLAGEFDIDGLPNGLQYTNIDLWVDFMIHAPPFFPNAFTRDEYISSCGAEDAPWSNQLDEVNLPVFYVSAAGGFGLVYSHTLDLMTNADISTLTVELHPSEEIDLDFAHVDLFTASNAPQLVWQPILDWIKSNHGNHPNGG